MNQTLVTHTSPDWDAITSCWLLQRYGGMADAEIVFVNTGNPDPAVLATATAVVDTGREYDPARLRFDHHQFPGQAANDDSAALLVWADIVNPQRQYFYLEPLVLLVFAGDTGKPQYGAEHSRTVGIHALLSAAKATRLMNDGELLLYGYTILDSLAAHLKARAEAAASLNKHTVYRSDDGLVWGLAGAPQGATWSAFEAGARIVVFWSVTPETVSVGAMRGGESQEPSLRELVLGLMNDGECEAEWAPRWDTPEYHELTRWYLHQAGFFAGRGTAKAPNPEPLAADFQLLCRFLDGAWKR